MALEAFFLRQITRLPPGDFVLRFTEKALQTAMRRIARQWFKQLQQPRHTLRL
jgi:hypothetical protein